VRLAEVAGPLIQSPLFHHHSQSSSSPNFVKRPLFLNRADDCKRATSWRDIFGFSLRSCQPAPLQAIVSGATTFVSLLKQIHRKLQAREVNPFTQRDEASGAEFRCACIVLLGNFPDSSSWEIDGPDSGLSWKIASSRVNFYEPIGERPAKDSRITFCVPSFHRTWRGCCR